MGATWWTWAIVTSFSPARAAVVMAACSRTRSARCPATFFARQSSLIKVRMAGDRRIVGSCFRAVFIRNRTCSLLSANLWQNEAGLRSNSSRLLSSSTLCSRSSQPCTSMQSPKRSRNWGRSSPSSGFMVPISVKFAACLILMPSRSTTLHPDAAVSRIRSTK